MNSGNRPSLPSHGARWAVFLALGTIVAAGAALTVYYAPGRPGSATEEGIRQFAESYFAVWSDGDMAAYREHFAPAAQIAFVEGGQIVRVVQRDPFVAQQAENIVKAGAKMTERMTSFSVNTDGTAAQVTADWELRRGRQITIGVDRFTLIRDPHGLWKIAFLLFYERDR